MIESMFFFLIVMAVLIIGYGMWARSPIILTVAAVLFIGLGAALLSGEEIEHKVGVKVTEFADLNIKDINDVYDNLTVDNDITVLAFANTLFYGGFGLVLLAGAAYYFKALRKEDRGGFI